MPLNSQQISTLLTLVITTEEDPWDCDRCFGELAFFAETKLLEREIPDALTAVEVHLRQCPCCRDEYEALLDGLRDLQTV